VVGEENLVGLWPAGVSPATGAGLSHHNGQDARAPRRFAHVPSGGQSASNLVACYTLRGEGVVRLPLKELSQ